MGGGMPTLSPQTCFGLVWGADFRLLGLGWRVEAGEEVGSQVPTETPSFRALPLRPT